MKIPLLLCALLLTASPARAAEMVAQTAAAPLRIATYNVDLSRDGPGLLLAELRKKPKPPLAAVLAVIRATRPDILLLTQFDHDLRHEALTTFRDLLAQGPEGIAYPHLFDAAVNAGVPSGLDLNGDGRLLGWNDALAFGKFPGDGGMAILSRYPINDSASRTFRSLLWADLPGAHLPLRRDGTSFLPPEALALLPLSSRSHWDVVVDLPTGPIHLLASHPTPPLYDGPERMNHLRNADEIGFWSRYLDGTAFRDDQGRDGPAPDAPLVVLGDLNADPFDGAGQGDALRQLLAHPRLSDPAPTSRGAPRAATTQGGANARHRGPPERDTVDYRDTPGPGNLRTDYILPSRDLTVVGAGVFWPAPGDPLAAEVAAGPAHRLVWLDLAPR